MMGRLDHDQEQFFYSFRLDEAVPEDHSVREIAAVLDLSWVVRVNLAYRWFCGLSIEDKIPDHSAFSRARNDRFRDSGMRLGWLAERALRWMPA
jgi:transposase